MSFLNRLSNREKLLGGITLASLLIALAYNLFLQDIFINWNQIKDEIEMKELLLAKNYHLIEEADRIDSDYKKLANYMGAQLNESAAASSVLRQIQSLAGNEIEIENIKPLDIKRYEMNNIYEFELEGNTSKKNLIKFLYNTATSGDALRIRVLTISSARTGDAMRYYMIISKLHII